MNIFLIGIGGGLGAISRFFFTEVTLKYIPLSYPIGTLGLNVIGCFLIGVFIG